MRKRVEASYKRMGTENQMESRVLGLHVVNSFGGIVSYLACLLPLFIFFLLFSFLFNRLNLLLRLLVGFHLRQIVLCLVSSLSSPPLSTFALAQFMFLLFFFLGFFVFRFLVLGLHLLVIFLSVLLWLILLLTVHVLLHLLLLVVFCS